jgi:hypothetical protein
MKGDVVPDADHVTRLCGGSHLREDGTIAATAYKPRPGETYLSVNWLEFFQDKDREGALAEVRSALAGKRKVGGTSRLAISNVGSMRAVIRQESSTRTELTVRHEPEEGPERPADPSHSGLYGILDDDMTVPELIAANVMSAVPAK